MAKRSPARTPKKDGVVRRPRNGANVNDSQSSRKATTRAQTAQDRPSQDQSNSKRKRSDYREPEGERKSRRIAGREAIDWTAQPTPQAEEDDESASQANTDTGNALPQASEPDSSVLRENQQERRSVEFLDVLATNVIMYRNVRLLTADWNKRLKREADLRYGKDGLIDLEARIRTLGAEEGEGHQQEPEQARKNREDRLERINIAVDYLARLLGPMNEQNRWLYTRTSRIYDFADLPQTSTALAFLPRKSDYSADERTQRSLFPQTSKKKRETTLQQLLWRETKMPSLPDSSTHCKKFKSVTMNSTISGALLFRMPPVWTQMPKGV